MSVGHGAMGFLSALRGYPELADEDDADRRPYIELRLGKEMTAGQWLAVPGSPGLYRQRAHFVLGGELRDIVGVVYEAPGQVGTSQLTRAESQAACASTTGTFYFSGEDAAILGSPAWDDPSGVWDTVSPFWDLYPPAELYVHLPADADPNSMTVVALLAFNLSGGGASPSDAHPTLGPNLLLNGGFESWASASDANNWTETAPAGTSVAREASIVRGGVYSAKLTTNGFATVKEAQTVTLISGRRYRLSGAYLIDPANAGSHVARILVGAGGSYLLPSGRDYASSGTPPTLGRTSGEYGRFLFDFIAPAASVTISFEGSGGQGTFYLDDLALQRIYRFSAFDARLASDSIPEVMTTCARPFGGQTMGLSSVSLMNGDGSGNGYFEAIFGQLLMLRKPIYLSAGGVFMDRSEVYRDGWQPRFAGLVEDFAVEDGRAVLHLSDYRTFLKKQVPTEMYSPASNPKGDNRVGGPRPLCFGRAPTNLSGTTTPGGLNYWIRPVRVDKNAGTGYGIYELANMAVAVNGINGTLDFGLAGPETYSCLSEEAARRADLVGAHFVDYSISEASFDPATGRITILADVTASGLGAFQDADHNHFIVCIARGYRDDAAGTYTGAASSVIEYPPHVARFILARLLGVPLASVDSASFGDTSGPSGYPLFIYTGDQVQDADEILAGIERSAQAVIVMDGAGMFTWVPYSNSTSKRTFYDRDYLSFSCGRAKGDVYSAINLTFPYFSRDGDAQKGGVIVRSIPGVAAKHGVFDTLNVATFLRHTPNEAGFPLSETLSKITDIADRYVKLESASPREAVFSAKGKLSDLKVADIITLNRSRALDPSGALSNVKFRIDGLNFNDTTGISRCMAVEYISPT